MHRGLLVVRFRFDGRTAYLPPLCPEPYRHGEHCENYAAVLHDLFADTESQGHPFRMMGVTAEMLERLHTLLPGRFEATADPAFADYIYDRESLASLAGKKLQSKRNHANRFERTYPNYEFRPLTSEWIDECWRLESTWAAAHGEMNARLDADAEQHSMRRVFKHWDLLQPLGGVLLVDGRVVASAVPSTTTPSTFASKKPILTTKALMPWSTASLCAAFLHSTPSSIAKKTSVSRGFVAPNRVIIPGFFWTNTP